MDSGHQHKPGNVHRRRPVRWPGVVMVGALGWTVFGDDSMARGIDVAGARSVDIIAAAGDRLVNIAEAVVATARVAINIALAVAAMAGDIADTLSPLMTLPG